MRPLAAALCLLLLPAAAQAGFWDEAWLDPALLDSHSLSGGSGFIRVPAPRSLPAGLLTAGLHRYRVSLGRGFPFGLEAGAQVELENWKLDEAEKRNLFYVRWAPLKPSRSFPLGLALGVEELGAEDLGLSKLGYLPLQALHGRRRAYAVAGGPLPGWPMLYAAAGYGAGDQRAAPFAALAFAPFAGMAALAELDQGLVNLGFRLLLSTQIKLDLSVSRLQAIDRTQPFSVALENNVRFGISYSERWP